MSEMIELSTDMHANGTMDDATFNKITLRSLKAGGSMTVISPLTGEDIRGLREQAHMSQAVFAQHLNLTAGYLSQLERGAKRPTGAALMLLDVIRRKGIDAIM